MNLSDEARVIDERISNHPLVKEWKAPIANGMHYSDPWLRLDVQPVNVKYSTRELELSVGIASKNGSAIVNVVWPYKSWKNGISDTHLTYSLERAIGLVEYLWNNHFFTAECAYPSTVITMEV